MIVCMERIGIVLAVVLCACGAHPASPAATPPTAPTTTAPSTAKATGWVCYFDEMSGSPCFRTDAECEQAYAKLEGIDTYKQGCTPQATASCLTYRKEDGSTVEACSPDEPSCEMHAEHLAGAEGVTPCVERK
jgi:hypothetical protein